MLLEEKVAKELLRRKKTLAIAESCSGGLLSHRLTNIPGSSRFFKLALVAYSNKAKIKLLKVPPPLIRKHGAVSGPVSAAMAKGVREIMRTDFGISITGIAGPAGGTKGKPVGLTFMALNTQSKTVSKIFHFKGDRRSIKTQAANEALRLLGTFLF